VLDARDRVQTGDELVLYATIDGHDFAVAPILSAPLVPGGQK
jgi:hypothetical protein